MFVFLTCPSEEERESPVGAMHAGRRDVIVTTDGNARGLHLPDMRHVISVDLPRDMDTYGARVGAAAAPSPAAAQ